MKTKILGLVWMLLLAACGAPAAPTLPPTALPSPLPSLAASAPSPTTAPTRAALATPTLPASAPTVRERFFLRELPGSGRRPLAVAALDGKVYALCGETANLAVIQNDRVVKFIPVGQRPGALAADPAHKRLFVSNAGDKSISLITNDQVAMTQTIGVDARTLFFFDSRLYVGSDSKGEILVLDPTTLQTQTRLTIPNAFNVINLAGDSARHRLYAAVYDKTAVIDTATWRVLAVLPTKGTYYTLAAHPAYADFFVAIYDSKTSSQFLTALDPNSGTARGRVLIGGDPHATAFTPDGTRLYVANAYANTISVIEPGALASVATIQVGLHPYGLAFDETARRLYVANYYGDSISVVDTSSNRVVATIPLAMLPTALAANERAGRVYIANASTDSVYVIEGTRVVKEIGVGRHPVDLARDPQSDRLFVASRADGALTIVDETALSVRATQPVTRNLTTVAVDPARSRLFAGDVILDRDTLAPVGSFRLVGNTIGSSIVPDWVRVNSGNQRLYALAWNGTPGSNSRTAAYSVDATSLRQRAMLPFYSTVYALAIDSDTNRVFIGGTHPLRLTNEFAVFDAEDKKLFSMALPGRVMGMEYNPLTRHLFIAFAKSYARGDSSTLASTDNLIAILDGDTFGEVARLTVSTPGKMTRLGNLVYVANREDGSVTLIEDVRTAVPPAPTPTFTPTPWSTWTPARATPSPRASATLPPRTLTLPFCALAIGNLTAPRWTPEFAARVGCPTETERSVQFALQRFEHGALYWREDERRIYALFEADATWLVFDDTWTSALPEDSCPSITVAPGRIKPRRGFGKVWCARADVRAKLGAGIAAEEGYSALAQKFARGQIFAGIEPNRAIVLYADGKWE